MHIRNAGAWHGHPRALYDPSKIPQQETPAGFEMLLATLNGELRQAGLQKHIRQFTLPAELCIPLETDTTRVRPGLGWRWRAAKQNPETHYYKISKNTTSEGNSWGKSYTFWTMTWLRAFLRNDQCQEGHFKGPRLQSFELRASEEA